MMELLIAIIPASVAAVSAVVVAIIEFRSSKDRKAAQAEKERTERRAQLREQESHLSMELMSAACALSLVTAKKPNGMHTNGDAEEAMDNARIAQSKYQSFLQETTARQVCKQ